VCAAAVNLGIMGWAGSRLSFATATYTSMGVSLGADFAIYLLFRIKEELARSSLEDGVTESLRTAGQAVVFVATAIAAGYATLLLSDFALWRDLGAYVGLMMLVSAVCTITLVPALVLLLRPRFLRRGNEQ
jgi:predicted RND superfamily exporter protein